jgi:hypothetical protein
MVYEEELLYRSRTVLASQLLYFFPQYFLWNNDARWRLVLAGQKKIYQYIQTIMCVVTLFLAFSPLGSCVMWTVLVNELSKRYHVQSTLSGMWLTVRVRHGDPYNCYCGWVDTTWYRTAERYAFPWSHVIPSFFFEAHHSLSLLFLVFIYVTPSMPVI